MPVFMSPAPSTQPSLHFKADNDLEASLLGSQDGDGGLITFFTPGVEEALSPAGAVMAILVAMIGTGVVALPFTFKLAGSLPGSLGLALMATLACLSMGSLCSCASLTRRGTYEEIGVQAVGKSFNILSHSALFCMITGSSAAYAMIAANVVETVLPTSIPRDAVVILCVVLMLPACMARNYKALRYLNTFCFGSFLCIAAIVLTKSALLRGRLPPEAIDDAALARKAKVFSDEEGGQITNVFAGLILALPMTCTVMNGHMALPLVYGELKRGWKPRVALVLASISLIAFAFYLAMAWVPYSVFGERTETDILKQLARTYREINKTPDLWVSAAQALLSITIIVKTSVMQLPLRTLVLRTLKPTKPLVSLSFLENVALTGGCLVLVAIIALGVPRLDLIIQIIGATSAVCLVYVFPGIFTLSLEKPSSLWSSVKAWSLILFGLSLSGLALGSIIRNQLSGSL